VKLLKSGHIPTPDQAGRLRVPPPRCVAPALLSMLGMRPTQIVVFAVALVAAPLLATAETSKQSGAHHAPKQLTKTDVAATPSAPGWDAAYAEARADMLAGRFCSGRAEVRGAFAHSAGSRQPPVGGRTPRACRTWAQGGFVLATPTQLALSKPMVNRRTLDELSILYGNAVLNGVFAGIVIDTYSKSKSAAGNILPPLGLAAAEAGIVALVDNTVGLRYGVAQSTVSGMYIGYEEALVWLLWHEAHYPGSDRWGDKRVAMLTWGLGTVGSLAGASRHVPWNNPWASRVHGIRSFVERRCGGHFGRRNRQEERHRVCLRPELR